MHASAGVHWGRKAVLFGTGFAPWRLESLSNPERLARRWARRYLAWNAFNAAGSSYACRASDRTSATVTHTNELTEADHAVSVISNETVDLGWKPRTTEMD
jgi:hypothetical protein